MADGNEAEPSRETGDGPEATGTLDVLLISPHIDYHDDGRPVRTADGLERTVPQGVLSIAQHLHEKGAAVRLLHLPAAERDDLDAALAGHPARLALVQCHWFLYGAGAVKAARAYRRRFPDARVLLGGYHASYFAADILANVPAVDGVILGEGERVAERVLAALSEGPGGDAPEVDFAGLGSLAWRRGGEVVVVPPGPDDLLPLDALPIIDPHAAPFAALRAVREHVVDAVSIDRGRCPRSCRYCVANTAHYPRENAMRPVDAVVRQIGLLVARGHRQLRIGEFSFLHRERLQELCTRLAAEGVDAELELETHPALFADPGLVDALARAGIRVVSLGVESGVASVQQRLGRGGTLAQTVEAVERIRDRGGVARCAWLANVPGTTAAEHAEELAALGEVIDRGGLAVWINSLLTLPGTEYYEQPERHGIRLLTRSFIDWSRFSLRAKQRVPADRLAAEPERFFTFVDAAVGGAEMARRQTALRDLAAARVETMARAVARADIAAGFQRDMRRQLEDYVTRGRELLIV